MSYPQVKLRIWVRELVGKTHTIEVSKTATVGDLKEKIQNLRGFPIDKQAIMVLNKMLTDDQIVSEVCYALCLEHGSLIDRGTFLCYFTVFLRE